MKCNHLMRSFRNVHVPAGSCIVEGDLHAPHGAEGLVVLVHGSGATRRDRANDAIAQRLEQAGFATLLVDLLEGCETHDRHNVFDVSLQADRLLCVLRWAGAAPQARALPIGLFGSDIGAGIVLVAAAKTQSVRAIVCRGGRPDTALYHVSRVSAPTLFLDDDPLAGWVESAYRAAAGEKELVRVRSTGDASAEAAALDAVARHAERWFSRHLARSPAYA